MPSPDEALDDLLAEGPASIPKAGDDDMSDNDSDMPADEFSMHATDFLDDALPMPDRIEALRNAILAAGGNPLGDEGLDF